MKRENSTIWRQRAGQECPTFPVNCREFRVREVCSAAILDCRNIHGIKWVLQEMFFESPSAPARIYPSLLGIAMRHGEGLRREPQSSTIPTQRFSRNLDARKSTRRAGGNCFQNCTMETPRHAISELLVGIFPEQDDFQCWRDSFKTEVRLNSQCHGSVKWRWPDLLTILRRRNQFKESLFLILRCLM